ncbi:hypothetical protein BY996DRAFT_2593081 [Phakopsora pachyrhizi]|nr:hypothetical protein BY996DRAFT_2593081 [Phakopsora pachyrhizi]
MGNPDSSPAPSMTFNSSNHLPNPINQYLELSSTKLHHLSQRPIPPSAPPSWRLSWHYRCKSLSLFFFIFLFFFFLFLFLFFLRSIFRFSRLIGKFPFYSSRYRLTTLAIIPGPIPVSALECPSLIPMTAWTLSRADGSPSIQTFGRTSLELSIHLEGIGSLNQ